MKAILELRTRAPRSPALLACGAFAALAFLPWAVGAAVTAPRVAASAALLGAALVLARTGLGENQKEAKLSKDRCKALLLTSGGAGGLYRADVELVDDGILTISEHADPAEVLRDVSAAIEGRAVPLRSTWGLPDGATPWFGSAARRAAPVRSQALTGKIWHGQSLIGWSVVGSATFIVLVSALMLLARFERGAATSALSIVLPAVSVALVYAIGAAIVSARVRIAIDRSTLRVEESVLGLRVRSRSVALGSVTDFYAVSPTGARAAHVLFFTRQGPFAVRGEPLLANELVGALRASDHD